MSTYDDQLARELDSPIGIVGVSRGGFGASLAETGPGYLYQPGVGEAIEVVQGAVYDLAARGMVANSVAAAATNASVWAATLAAYAASSATSAVFQLPPGTIYTNSQLQVTSSITDNKTLRVAGYAPGLGGVGGTWIRATTAMQSPFAILAPRVIVEYVGFDADRLATYALYASNVALGIMRRCIFKNALLDGLHVPATGGTNNNSFKLEDCISHGNGTLHATAGILSQYTKGTRATIAGTATTTAGNTTISFSGAPDLTTLSIRRGDILRIGDVRKTLANSGVTSYASGSDYMLIESVSAASITVQNNSVNTPTFSASGLNFAIGVGDGVRDIRHGDTNIMEIHNLRSVENGGSGIAYQSLYGPAIRGGNFSYNNVAGLRIGTNNNSQATESTYISHTYVEDVSFAYYFGVSCSSVVVMSPVGTTEASTSDLFFGCRLGSGIVIGNGTYTSIPIGMLTNCVIQVRNNGGTIQHRIVDEIVGGSGANAAMVARIVSPSTTYTATPSVASGVAFATGLGIDAGSTSNLLLDQRGVAGDIVGTAVVESNTTASSAVSIAISSRSTNVNGTTKTRLSFVLMISGVAAAWSTANIGNGTHIAFRFNGMVR